MGSIISAIYDDYDTYKYLCELKAIAPFDIRDNISFYDHAEEIIKAFSPEEHEEYKNHYWYNKLK